MLSLFQNASTTVTPNQNFVTPSALIVTTSSGTRPGAPIFGSSTNTNQDINQATIDMARKIRKSARFKTRDWNIGYNYIFTGPDSEDDQDSDFRPNKRSKNGTNKDSPVQDLTDLPNLVVGCPSAGTETSSECSDEDFQSWYDRYDDKDNLSLGDMSMPSINFGERENNRENGDIHNRNRQSSRTDLNHSGFVMNALSDSMSIDSIESDDNGVYESYYDSQPIDLSVIIEDLLKGDKYEQAQGNYMLEKEQMISNNVTTTIGSRRDALTWSVRSDVRKEEINKQKPFSKF